MFELFVGWDWGGTAHDVTVIDSAGERVHRMAIPHTEDGIARAVAKLADYGDRSGLPVAIETTRGLVVDRLLAAGHPVISVHPNAFHAVRPRWGAARAKNDPGDSFKLADYARTDIHRLPVLAPTLPETLELQALTRQRDDQLGLRIAAVNQLAALLDQYWPGGKTIFAQLHSPIALDFLDRYPTPQTAAGLTPARIEGFCRRRGYSGRRSGAELLDRLCNAPISASRLGEPVVSQMIRAQVAVVRALQAGIDTLDTAIAEKATAHPYAGLLVALPRIGTLNLAQIIGEVGPILERATSFDQLAAETGLAPVTRASGKTHTVAFRHATNRRARQALHTWLDNSRRSSDWAQQRYAAARARGQRHPHALRTIGRAWLRVIWACWRLRAALALAPAPDGFTVAEFAAKVHALTGVDHCDYTVRQAGYDLRKLRGKRLVDKPGRTRRYHVPPPAARTIAALLTLRDQVIAPILAAVRSPRMGRKPAHWTRVDRHYERIRVDMQTLFNDLAIETPLAA